MKRTIIFGLLFGLLMGRTSAQELTTQQKLAVQQTVDSLLNSYEQYSCLTENTTSFSDKYANALAQLFEKGKDAKVPADIPLFATKKVVDLSDYISMIKSELPSGLDVLVKNVKKEDLSPSGNGYTMNVVFDKSMLGIYNDVQRFDHMVKLKMALELTSDLKDGKISALSKVADKAIPKAPEGLAGRQNVKAGTKGVFYSVEAMPGVDYYTWILPEGWEGESSLNTIFIDFGPKAENGEMSVTAHNSKGTSEPVSLALEVEPSPDAEIIPYAELKSRWAISGEGGLLSATGASTYSFEGRGFLHYRAYTFTNEMNLAIKSGVGIAYYNFSINKKDGSPSDQYLSSVEIPVMGGIDKTWGNWGIAAATGVNFIYPLASTKDLNTELSFGWISDIEGGYTPKFWHNNLTVFAGLRYNMLFGLKSEDTSASINVFGVHGGIKLNLSVLKPF